MHFNFKADTSALLCAFICKQKFDPSTVGVSFVKGETAVIGAFFRPVLAHKCDNEIQ